MSKHMTGAEPVQAKQKRKKVTAFEVINATVLTLFALLCLYPFVNQVLISFASPKDYLQSVLIVIPREFNFEAYKYILFQGRMGNAFLVSFFVTACGTTFNMIMTAFGAYALTKKNMPGRKAFFVFVLITMFFGGGLIPFYLVVKEIGLMGSPLSLILPFSINTFNMIILRNFFNQVPESVIESCKMDGAREFRVLFAIVIPLSLAGLATIALFYLVERWNDWYWPMLFLTNSDLFPLALELRNILSSNQSSGIGGGGVVDPSKLFSEGQKSATIVIAIAPIVAVYPFIQRYFVKGVMLGSIKE